MRSVLHAKIARLRAKHRPRVLDLFSGCGGLSLGFQAAGCDIAAAVEIDPDAARSHGANFHPGDERHAVPRDITATGPDDLTRSLGLGPANSRFDIVVGGPPCQAFARVGRSKLRAIADHPEAYRHDPRSRLYLEYLDYVDACAPLAVVMENVPDMINHGGHNIAEEVCEVLKSRGFRCAYTLLNAAFYGVPQMRERMFLVGIREELSAAEPVFPRPTHWIDLPSGYESSRSVALKLLARGDLFGGKPSFSPPPAPDKSLPPAVTVWEAIDDLPRIDARGLLSSGSLRRGARRFDMPLAYGSEPHTRFAEDMRSWPGFRAASHVLDHVIRYLPRDYPLFARMSPGDQYPDALRHALNMFDETLGELGREGRRPRKGTKAWKVLRDSIVPPYDDGKFPNKWRKMEPDRPARTLMAHLGKDSYSHIHYDSSQARTISVREAARLQSFPDGFRFCGTMNPAFRQIGNAVPPLLARAVAREVVGQITSCIDAGVAVRRTAQ